MWQVKKKKENFNLNLQTPKIIEEKKIEKKNFEKKSKCHFPKFSKNLSVPQREWDVGYVKILT